MGISDRVGHRGDLTRKRVVGGRSEQVGVENVMTVPIPGELEPVCVGAYHLSDLEGALKLVGQFLAGALRDEVSCVEPNFVIDLILRGGRSVLIGEFFLGVLRELDLLLEGFFDSGHFFGEGVCIQSLVELLIGQGVLPEGFWF